MFAILIISLLLLSHVLTDFYFQTDKLVEEKKQSRDGLIKHTSHFLFCSLLLTIVFLTPSLMAVILLISISHFFIDMLKIRLNKENSHLKTFLFFLSDQLAHIFVIIGCYPILKELEPNSNMNRLIEKTFTIYPFLEKLNNIDLLSYIILTIVAFLFSIKGGTILSLMIINLPLEKEGYKQNDYKFSAEIQHEHEEIAVAIDKEATVSQSLKLSSSEEEDKKRYGKTIGVLERIIIITAMLINKFELIAILTAIKSIGRFKELNNKTSDYYIIGTLASFSIAFIIGLFLIATKKILLN